MNFKSRSSKKRDLSDPSNDGKITKKQEKVPLYGIRRCFYWELKVTRMW